MTQFLEYNTIQLKNGECKNLLDRLIESEKVFKKYSQFTGSNKKIGEIDIQSFNDNDNSPDSRSRAIQHKFYTNPNITITKESSSQSLNTPQQQSRTQKSKFYQEENESTSQKNQSAMSLTKVENGQEQSDKQSQTKINMTQSNLINSSYKNYIEDNQFSKNQQSSQISINSSPINRGTPTQNYQNMIHNRRFSFESFSPNSNLFKRRSINIFSYQAYIKKMYSVLRFILTKVGFLLHYQKMQNYFFREEDIMKIRQHHKLRLFQHKRTSSFEHNQVDQTPLSNESPYSNQSPISEYSAIGVMSPFMNSPLSCISSGLNQKLSKEEQFNMTIHYQKVNENNDANDIDYINFIYILRTARKLENDNILLSKGAKKLFYSIKTQMLDSTECFLKKRQFLLHKFFIWKMKRWYTQYKRLVTENKKITLYVNQYMEKQFCRICDQKVYLKHFKQHSVLCKQREELKKDLKINMKNINTEMFYFLQKSRSLGVKCQLLQKKVEKIQKLQEQNVEKQINQLKKKSFQSFNEENSNKPFLDDISTQKPKQGENQFKEYLSLQKIKNSKTSKKKSKKEKKKQQQSLNLEKQLSCNKISEDEDDDCQDSNSESENVGQQYQQHSLSQFDRLFDKEVEQNGKKSSSKNITSNSALSKKSIKINNKNDDIQNKENNPKQQQQLQQLQQNSQYVEQQSSQISFEKQSSRPELQIINELQEYDDDNPKTQNAPDGTSCTLGQKSNSLNIQNKNGRIREANSVSSILFTSDEDDKQFPITSFCTSTPNIDALEKNEYNMKQQNGQLGLIVEENEASKNPSKDENTVQTINEMEKLGPLKLAAQDSLIELTKKFEEEQQLKQNINKKEKKVSNFNQTKSNLPVSQVNQNQIQKEDEKQSKTFDQSSEVISPSKQKISTTIIVISPAKQKQHHPEFEVFSQLKEIQPIQFGQSPSKQQSSPSKQQISLLNKNEQNNIIQNNKNISNHNVKFQFCNQQNDSLIHLQESSPQNKLQYQTKVQNDEQKSQNITSEQNFSNEMCNNSKQKSSSHTKYDILLQSKNDQQNNFDEILCKDNDQNQEKSKNINYSSSNQGSQYSSLASSPDFKQKIMSSIKGDLEEKYNILQTRIKNTEMLNQIESEFNSSSIKNLNQQKDLQNKSNNIRIQLSRLASLESSNVNSPYRKNQQVSMNQDDKFGNSQNNSKSSFKDDSKSPPQRINDIFSFSQFNQYYQSQQNQSKYHHANAEDNIVKEQQKLTNGESSQYHLGDYNQEDKNQNGKMIQKDNRLSIDEDKHQSIKSNDQNNTIEKNQQSTNQNIKDTENSEVNKNVEEQDDDNESDEIDRYYQQSNIRSRVVSIPCNVGQQRENYSSSPSSSSSINDNNKQLNSVSFTQFKDSIIIDDKHSKQKQGKQLKASLKKGQTLQPTQSNKDNKLVLDVVKLSHNFELKIKQHQLKSNHICLRIFELIQQLSKIFFMQDFSNNWKRKRMILDETKQKIEFLLKKSMIHKDYSAKIQNILQTFTQRVELLEKLQNVEKKLTKQFEDINEEMEKSDDNLSNESGQTKQSNVTTNKIISQQNNFLRNNFKTGTNISSKTIVSKDSYLLESPTIQSEHQLQPSKHNIISNDKLNVNLSLQQYINKPYTYDFKQQSISANTSPNNKIDEYITQKKDEIDDNYRERATTHPVKSLADISNNFHVYPHSSEESQQFDSPKNNQAISRSGNAILQNNKRRNTSLNIDIKNTIFKKINKQLQKDQVTNDQSKVKENQSKQNLSSIQKFDQIMKQAMFKFENDQVDIEKPPKYRNGYFSDGDIDGCYQCLENTSKKESKNETNINEFEFLKLISKGAFGRVWLVKKKNTDNVYAMKIINLAENMNKNNLLSLQNERDIFGIVSGDFVVKAVYTFSHESYLCFVMEYMIGGDLGAIMQQYGVLDESVAKFYIAEIILACSQLHKAGIVHRDLKPDNLLLDSKGHLKLTDFGLSDMGMKSRNMDTKQKKFRQEYNNLKRGMDRISSIKGADKIFSSLTPQTKKDKTRELKQMKSNLDVILNKGTIAKKMKNKQKIFRIIGTPDYIPPEVINGSSNLNSPTLDWWSVGVILFEMLIGIPPFNDETVDKIFDNIVNMRVPWDQINIGYGEDEISPEAEDLIKKLMDPNPATRLGVNGVQEIQQHQFFNNFNWEKVRNMSAPVIPKVKNILDTSNFDKSIQYSDKEKIDPFFGLSKEVEDVNKAKDMLKSYNFQMKRYDILYEENCQQLEEIQKKMKYMEEEIEKDEKELEQLEDEYGSDNNDFQESQPFTIPKSIVTFQDLESINHNNSYLCTQSRLTKEESEEQIRSLKNIDEYQNYDQKQLNKKLREQVNQQNNKKAIMQIFEDQEEHIGSTNSIELTQI